MVLSVVPPIFEPAVLEGVRFRSFQREPAVPEHAVRCPLPPDVPAHELDTLLEESPRPRYFHTGGRPGVARASWAR